MNTEFSQDLLIKTETLCRISAMLVGVIAPYNVSELWSRVKAMQEEAETRITTISEYP